MLDCGRTSSLYRSFVLIVLASVWSGSVAAQSSGNADREAFLAGKTADCPGCDLSGVRLKRRDLSGADLTNAKLDGAAGLTAGPHPLIAR